MSWKSSDDTRNDLLKAILAQCVIMQDENKECSKATLLLVTAMKDDSRKTFESIAQVLGNILATQAEILRAIHELKNVIDD